MVENLTNVACKVRDTQYSSGADSDESALLFNNLIWLSSKEAALFLRKTVGAVHTLVSRGQLRARKFRNRLYFKKSELSYLIETSQFRGGI